MVGRRLLLIGLLGGLSGCTAVKGPDIGLGDSPKANTSQEPLSAGSLLEACDKDTRKFFEDAQWRGFRNLTGGASGIFIAPSSTTAGFIVGAQFGHGVVLARHGQAWSDPVFVTLSNYDIGLLAGAAKSTVVMLILTDDAIDQFISGTRKVSTAGGFALGNWGAGGLGAGGISGGAQVLTAQTSSGLFAGGGLGSAQMQLDEKLNEQAYGAAFDAARVLARNGGRVPQAEALRQTLSQAVRSAWSG